ncbi:MAG: F0F1 ATP synthase subunit B [Candidatus Omnitrophota bacterium]|nr:F0F1 ATP synthase subunit B [Candidatus Omnitrophota bacterium]
MELLKLLSANEIIAQVVNFLLLLIVLRIFLWRRVLKLLDERREKIRSQLEGIESAKKEAKRMRDDYQKELNAVETIKKLKIQEGIEEARKEADEIKREALLNAQRIMDSAESDIKQEIAKAREGLKDEIIDLTIRGVENVVGEKLTEEGDRKLVKDFLDNAGKKQ